MTEQKRQVTELIKAKTIEDVSKSIENRKIQIEKWQKFWKNKQEKYFEENFDADSASVKEVIEIRKFINLFLTKKINEIETMDEQHQKEALRLMIPFNSDGGIKEFLLHFFQLKSEGKNIEFEARDTYTKEAYLLYDIYRIKQTITGIDAMRKSLGKPDKIFNSRYKEEDKKNILIELRKVLVILIKYTIKPDYRTDLMSNIDASYMSKQAVAERRQNQFLYCYDHVIEKYDYRNLFFLMYFEKGLVAKHEGKPKKFRYNYAKFEVLKQEYLIHWLENKLGNNASKKEIYDLYQIGGESLSTLIENDESKENRVLNQMSTGTFNALSEDVNERVDQELKTDMPILCEKKGALFDFKKKIEEAKNIFRAPLAKLSSLIESITKDEPIEIISESVSTLHDYPVVEEEVVPEQQIKVTLLNQKQIPYFYLWEQTTEYKKKLNIVRAKMGDDYQKLRKLFSKFNKRYRQKTFLIRRTPKFDWALPFVIKFIDGDQIEEYLLIMGAETSIKYKSMGYSTGEDEYQFMPYFVFASKTVIGKFGEVVGERSVRGIAFNEYDARNPAVCKKVLELMEVLEKNKLR